MGRSSGEPLAVRRARTVGVNFWLRYTMLAGCGLSNRLRKHLRARALSPGPNRLFAHLVLAPLQLRRIEPVPSVEGRMKSWCRVSLAVTLVVVSLVAPTRPAAAQRGQAPPVVVRPKDQRVPAPYNINMVRPIAMPDNLWMSELTILEMRDLVR